jgi:hypothetical protein
MGKKRHRKAYTSKGTRSNVSKDVLKMVSRGVTEVERYLNLSKAWRAGKNPWITVRNIANEPQKRFIRVRANDLWGNPKFAMANLFKMSA